MTNFYTGDPKNWRDPDKSVMLPEPVSERLGDPRHYKPHPQLVDAVNLALMLGQPLLVTGEPGTGKTELAKNVAYELGLGLPIKFEVKSSTEARDLFYTFDTLRQFHDYHVRGREEVISNEDYITFQALGLALLCASPADEVADLLAKAKHSLPKEVASTKMPRRLMVLIDEIDKAPRDVPNDILNEIELGYFRIPELDRTITASPAHRPVLIITSNSEKNLPDAFLRRCVYFDIPFPDEKALREIVDGRLPAFVGQNALLDDAVQIVEALRDVQSGLKKRPGTAELLVWLTALLDLGMQPDRSLHENEDAVFGTVSALVKDRTDQDRAREIVQDWMEVDRP